MLINISLFTDNASRYCTIEGKWDLTNYDNCHHIGNGNKTCLDWEWEHGCSAYATSAIYYTGYTISLVALVLAVIVFMNFK